MTVVGSFDTTRGEPQIVVDEVFAVEDLPSRLATRLEILFDETGGEPDGDSIQHRMRFVSGHLRQASGSVQSLEGRPVETYVHLNLADGRRVVLSAPELRVVPSQQLTARIREAGADGVRVRGGFVPAPSRDGRRRGGEIGRAHV